MANLLGLGVYGTFGKPHGFQQAFNLDIQFNHSLDLDPNEIEMFPHTELFAVKREVFRGVYSIAFCLYSYSREMNAGRNGTFLGSCIVLQQVYLDPEKIYRLLRELHNDLINNTQNVNNNTIQARQAVNLVVREPGQFQSAKFGVKPIDDTPFYTTSIDTKKKFFVHTEHIESASQIVNFFDEALKNFNDADTLYFTYSDKIIDYVNKKGALKTIEWEDFVEHKNKGSQEVVRTKKGLKAAPADAKPVAPAPAALAPPPAIINKAVPNVNEAGQKETILNDAVANAGGFPFDEWGEQTGWWDLEEATKRVNEYNRLLAWAKHLQARNTDLKEQLTNKVAPGDNISESESAPVNTPQNQSFPGEIPVNYAHKDTNEGDHEIIARKKPFYKKKAFFLITVGAMLLVIICFFLAFRKHIFKKHARQATETTEVQDTLAHGALNHSQDTSSPNKEDTSDTETQTSDGATQSNVSLSPRPNSELAKSELITLSKIDIKNRTLHDITNIIFLQFPDNVGDIYKRQSADYAKALMQANMDCFQKKGNDYICIKDTLHHVPAYHNPKLPVVFPK